MVLDLAGVCAKSLQSCPTLCNPMDCSPPGVSVHRISQARKLEWVAISSSQGSSQPRDWTCLLRLPHRMWILYHWATQEAPVMAQRIYDPDIINHINSTTDVKKIKTRFQTKRLSEKKNSYPNCFLNLFFNVSNSFEAFYLPKQFILILHSIP